MMRKFTVLPLAALLTLALAGPAAAAPNVNNTSGSAKVANGEWYADGAYGYAYFAVDSAYGARGEFFEESGEWIPCDDTGEYYGFVGDRTYGWSDDFSLVIDAKLSHGSVTGTLDLVSETVNDCTGEYDGTGEATSVTFTAELDASGRAARFRSSGSYKLPGEFNAHSTQSGMERMATGSIEFGGGETRAFDNAILASIAWRDHSNN
jgi:hypothetical protein